MEEDKLSVTSVFKKGELEVCYCLTGTWTSKYASILRFDCSRPGMVFIVLLSGFWDLPLSHLSFFMEDLMCLHLISFLFLPRILTLFEMLLISLVLPLSPNSSCH